ncbi:MAG: dockerin type I domain-containing protein [Planctomycetota bacterium]
MSNLNGFRRIRRGFEGIQTRRLGIQELESRRMLAGDLDLATSFVQMDVNTDGAISAIDALNIINDLEDRGAREVAGDRDASRRDVNRDGRLSPVDALRVINHLGRQGGGRISMENLVGDREGIIGDTQRENLRSLFMNLNAIRLDSDVTAEQIVNFVRRIGSTLEGATLPSIGSIESLLDTVQTSADDGEFSPDELDQIESDLLNVFESMSVSEENAQQLIDDFRDIIESDGIEQENVAAIINDLQVIVEEFQDRFSDVEDSRREHIRGLVTGIIAVLEDSDLSEQQIEEFIGNVRLAFEDATLPDLRLVVRLFRDTRAALRDGEITNGESAELTSGLDSVLESANISSEERGALLEDVEDIIETTELSADELELITRDVLAVGARLLRDRFGLQGFLDFLTA